MLRVLSTKLRVDQVESFQKEAEAQGETKSGLLKRLVQEFLKSADRVEELIPVSIHHQVAVLDKGHSEYSPHYPHQEQTKMLTSTSGPDSDISSTCVDHPLNAASLSTSRKPASHNAKQSRSANSPKQPSDIGWLIIMGLLVLGLMSTSAETTGRAPKRLAQGIGPGVCR